MNGKLVEIVWLDAWSSNQWYDDKDMPDAIPVTINTVGWVIKDTAHGILLAGTKGENSTYNSVVFRPRESIVSVRELT